MRFAYVPLLAFLPQFLALPLDHELPPRDPDCDKAKYRHHGGAANSNGNTATNIGFANNGMYGFRGGASGAGEKGQGQGGATTVVWVTKTVHRGGKQGGGMPTGDSSPTGDDSPSPAGPTGQDATEAPPTKSQAPATKTAQAQAPSQTAKSGSSDTGMKAMVGLHTDFRAQYGAGPVTWDDKLASYAQDYFGKGCSAGNPQHSHGPYGENLSGSPGGAMDAALGFSLWSNEAKNYDWNNPGFGVTTGHFTQVVWKATQRIGCASIQCSDGTLIACEYDPPGNFVGDNNQHFKDNVGTKV